MSGLVTASVVKVAIDKTDSRETVSEVLLQHPDGGPQLFNRIFPLLWWELRALAKAQLANERDDHTLQPTALVNELYLKVRHTRQLSWQEEQAFLRFAAYAMHQILVDHARRRARKKRPRVEGGLETNDVPAESAAVPDLLAIEGAIERLRALDPRQARIVELRALAELSFPKIAELLSISTRTVHRDWRTARAWLCRELSREPGRPVS